MIEIRKITAAAALEIRHRVLWPNKPAAFCAVSGDETATHMGAFVDETLVSVLSLFDEADQVQLRKFATLPDWQGQGVGTKLFQAAEAAVHADGKAMVFHARKGAITFYKRQGYAQVGAPFTKYGNPYIHMAKLTVKS